MLAADGCLELLQVESVHCDDSFTRGRRCRASEFHFHGIGIGIAQYQNSGMRAFFQRTVVELERTAEVFCRDCA